jgi:SAM-dependent methyltransferase
MIPPCAAVTALGEVLAYGAPKLAPVLERIHAALRPGGILIFDVIMSGKAMNYRNWVEGKGWAMGLAVSEADGNLTRRIAIFRRHGKYWRRTDEHHVQRIFTRAEVMGALRRAGFAVRTLDAYGDQKMLPRRLAFFARKKA